MNLHVGMREQKGPDRLGLVRRQVVGNDMLNYGRGHLLDAPHLTIFPGVAIAILVLGFNFLGDGLRDVLDPAAKRRV